MTRFRDESATSRGALARAGFTDVERAARLFAEPAMSGLGRPEVVADFAVAADPDLALLLVSRMLASELCPPELTDAFSRNSVVRRRLVKVLGVSAGLGESLVRTPARWVVVAHPSGPMSSAAVRAAVLAAVGADPSAETPVAAPGQDTYVELRREYRKQLLRIADNDINDAVRMGTVTAELSDLADAVLEASLAIARSEVADQHVVRLGVVAMGKCGARELNYLSDVDVIFVAEPVAGVAEVDAIRVGTQLAQRMMNVTIASTIEGAIWEIDAGLRPEGKSGALVRTLSSHLGYYQRWAKTWEFQALLKARAAAGDLSLAGDFVAETRPLVWSASRRPDFVAEVQAMRRRVEANIPAKHADRELKLGVGGIRDIEFSVQMLQMVHGASDLTVRAPDTLTALEQLATWGYVGREDAAALATAYTFQRTLEHRLQLRSLRRTHMLPDDPDELRWLGRAIGLDRDPAGELLERWRQVSRDVRRLHEKLFYRPLLNAVAKLEPGQARITPAAAVERLTMLGYTDPNGALRHIEALSSGVSRRAAIQRTLLPVMLGWFADGPDPDAGLLGFRAVSDALGATPWYLRLLRDESAVAERLARVLSTSRYASDLLTRAPEAVRILADVQSMTPHSRDTLVAELDSVVRRHSTAASAAAAVRGIRRRELFRIAAADLAGICDVAGVGTALCDLTDATVSAVLTSAMAEVAVECGGDLPTRLLVVAMGRLGGRDMSYASDADVMYVHEPLPGVDEKVAGDVAKRVFTLLREALAVPSPDPPLLLDADLRPEGRQGVLVRTLDSYRAYYARFSAPWEAQALLRARPMAGDMELAASFITVVDPVRYPAGGLRTADLMAMRRLKARMESERLPRGVDPRRHTKLGPGGLSDVEWVVQKVQQEQAGEVPELRTTATLAGMAAAVAHGFVGADDAQVLLTAWHIASHMRNANTLVLGKPSDTIPTDVRDLAAVSRVMGYQPGHSADMLEDYLRATRRARVVFDRLFYGLAAAGPA